MSTRLERVIDISIVIPVLNGADTLAAQLEALMAQRWSGSWEIVVVDNGSTDSTKALVEGFRSRDSRIQLIDASERSGAGIARNIGVECASSDAIAFCDADDVVAPGWLAAMGEGLREHDCVGGRNLFDLLNPDWLATAFYTTPPDRLETFGGVFPFVASCNLGVRRAVLDRIGGFDDAYAPAEDIEFCLRMWIAGYELKYLPEAVVQYRYRPSMKSLWRRSRSYGAACPAIVRRLREMGKPTPVPKVGVRSWVWLVRKLPTLRTRRGRARWVVVAGGKLGRLSGSVRQRTLYL